MNEVENGVPSVLPRDNSAGTVYLAIDSDTSRLQRKLRAIAKHLTALADDLEAIDAEEDGHAVDRP